MSHAKLQAQDIAGIAADEIYTISALVTLQWGMNSKPGNKHDISLDDRWTQADNIKIKQTLKKDAAETASSSASPGVDQRAAASGARCSVRKTSEVRRKGPGRCHGPGHSRSPPARPWHWWGSTCGSSCGGAGCQSSGQGWVHPPCLSGPPSLCSNQDKIKILPSETYTAVLTVSWDLGRPWGVLQPWAFWPWEGYPYPAQLLSDGQEQAAARRQSSSQVSLASGFTLQPSGLSISLFIAFWWSRYF